MILLKQLIFENVLDDLKDEIYMDDSLFLRKWWRESVDNINNILSQFEKASELNRRLLKVMYKRGNAKQIFKKRQLWIDDKIKYLRSILQKKRVDLNFIPDQFLTESKEPEIKTLKKNKKSLTDEEREQVMKAGAVWHNGLNGEPSPAIQKSVVNGKTWYWCATHRCGVVKPTLKGAIAAFPEVEKTS